MLTLFKMLLLILLFFLLLYSVNSFSNKINNFNSISDNNKNGAIDIKENNEGLVDIKENNGDIDNNPITFLKQRGTKGLLTKEWENPFNISDIRHLLSVYDSFVPVIGKRSSERGSYLDVRRDMFDTGIYPGIEYRITDIRLDGANFSISSLIGLITKLPTNNNSSFIKNSISYHNNESIDRNEKNIKIDDENDLTLYVRPVYPLIEQLERPWPIQVKLKEVPYFLTKGMYNTVTVLVSLSASFSFFMSCIILSNLFTLSFVNSKSMVSLLLLLLLLLSLLLLPIL